MSVSSVLTTPLSIQNSTWTGVTAHATAELCFVILKYYLVILIGFTQQITDTLSSFLTRGGRCSLCSGATLVYKWTASIKY